MIIQLSIIACLVAIACAIPGTFLVIRGDTMLSDAITHSVLLGIVLAFFAVKDLNSPWLLLGATLIGVLAVWLIESLQQTRLMPNDAAIGIIFPIFFSLGIILMTRFASDIHLDTDAVLVGELAFAPFNTLIINGQSYGPIALWTMGGILLLNMIFVLVFYKELKVSTFDPEFSKAIGFSPTILHYLLMTLISLTAVGAYDTVGSVLVVGYMVGPGLSATLLSDNLKKILMLAVLYALVNSIFGVVIGFYFDVALAGMIAVITGLTTFLTFLFSPKKGLVSQIIKDSA